MVKEVIIRNPSEKLLELIKIMKEKKYSAQEKLEELKECTFTINIE